MTSYSKRATNSPPLASNLKPSSGIKTMKSAACAPAPLNKASNCPTNYDLQRQLAERETSVANLETRLGAEITTLHQQLEQERSAAAQTHDELLQARNELAATREQLEAQLRHKDAEIGSLRASAIQQSEQLSNRIDELQFQLAEKQLLAEQYAIELDHLRTSVTRLNEQLNEEATNHAQALGLWQDSQAQHSTEIAQLTTARDELLYSQTALEVQLDQARGANAGFARRAAGIEKPRWRI